MLDRNMANKAQKNPKHFRHPAKKKNKVVGEKK